MSNVGLLAGLLETVLQDNKALFLELNIGNVISRFKRENPVLTLLAVTDELRIEPSGLQDDAETGEALSALIFTIKEFLEIFIGSAETGIYFSTSIANYRKKVGEENAGILSKSYSELFQIGEETPESSIEALDELGKVSAIFLRLLSRIAAESAEGNSAILSQVRKCGCVKSVSDLLDTIEFTQGTTVKEAVTQLSAVVEKSGLPLSVFEWELSTFGRIPEELGIITGLFGGALSRTVRFGCGAIDALFRNGIGKDDTLVLEGPSGVEKEILAGIFAREGLQKGGCVIIVSAGCSGVCVRRKLEVSGVNMGEVDQSGRFIFVDWHTRHTERITSIEVSGSTIKVSNDLTNLAVGIDMALRSSKDFPTVRLVMDIVSPTSVVEGFDRMHDFLSSLRAKLKNAGCGGLVLLNRAVHPPDQLDMLEDIFDGTMCIERSVEHGKVRSSFRIISYSGGGFNAARLPITVTGRGLEIDGPESGKAPELVKFDHDEEKATMGLPGIESLSPDGLPVGSSFLVWIPSSVMPADYVKPVVMEAQKEGHAILLALSSVNTDTIGEWMSENGLSRKGLIDRGLLQIVDWYGQKSSKVLGMEIDEGIVRTSKDLTHLGVGIDLSLRKISEQMTSLAVLEVISPALRLFDTRTVYSFAQSINAKLASRKYTSFTLMERDAHDTMTCAAVEELFDGIIDIRNNGGTLELGILSMRGCHFQQEYRQLTKVRGRLNIDVSRKIEDAEIVETIATHGLSARIKALEKELEETLREKDRMDKRLKELTQKELEYDTRHTEMQNALAQVEDKMKKQAEMLEGKHMLDPGHRDEMARLLKVMDGILENLPKDVIDSFARSEDFKLYEKILKMYLEDNR